MKNDNPIANSYFDNPKDWISILPPKSRLLRIVHGRRYMKIFYFIYKKAKITPNSKPWEISKIMQEIKQLVDLFLSRANTELIDPKIYELRSL